MEKQLEEEDSEGLPYEMEEDCQSQITTVRGNSNQLVEEVTQAIEDHIK